MDKQTRQRRHKKIRTKVSGTANRPRANVYRSNSQIYIQFIDDNAGKTVLSLDTRKTKTKDKDKTQSAKEAGKAIADEAKSKEINHIVFDRGGYKYHGRIKAVAEGMREGGLIF